MPYDYPDPSQQWIYIDWQIVNNDVHEMQRAIARAVASGNHNDILSTQDVLNTLLSGKTPGCEACYLE